MKSCSRNKNKKIILFSLLLFFLSIFLLLINQVVLARSEYSNDSTIGQQPGSVSSECKDPSNPKYDTQECIRQRLGLNQIQIGFITINDPDSIINVVFGILISLSTILGTFFVIKIAITDIIPAADNADKRKKGFVSIGFTVLAVLLSYMSYPLISLVVYTFAGVNPDDTILDCDNLPPNASKELKDRCKKIQSR